ncbi:MAG: hypothetical protein LBS41_05485 [Streptococcaceae bacterium]|nr:hypothetical protein [Streptococcaceae bacterium]
MTYDVGQKYTVVIPDVITLTNQSGAYGDGGFAVTINAASDALKLPNAKKLTVAIKTGTFLELGTTGDVADGSDTGTGLNYTVNKGTAYSADSGDQVTPSSGAFVEAVTGETTNQTQNLFIKTGAPKLAGTYEGTLTFTVDPAVNIS